MRTWLPVLFLSILTLALGGCAVMSKTDCLQGNWRDAGINDAQRGYPSSERLGSRTRVCAKHGAAANNEEYLIGYKAGLQRYCRPEQGFFAGIENQSYRGICPAPQEQAFLQQYISGLHQARRDVWLKQHWLEGELFDARIHRSYAGEDEDLRRRARARINRLTNRLDNLRHQHFQINRKIALWGEKLQSS